MQVVVRNWRCIEHASFELEKVNVFVGQNATGKSSLAYALYFFSRASRADVNSTLKSLYGVGIRDVVRFHGKKPQYPVEIRVGKNTLKIDEVLAEPEKFESPWKDEFLLSSGRLAYFKVTRALQKLVDEIKADDKFTVSFIYGFKSLIEKLIFPPASLFLSDLNKILTGYRIGPLKGDLKTLGRYIVRISPLLTLLSFTLRDPFTNLELPAELAPDGQVDQMLIDLFLERAERSSLVVVEEPEVYKNPLFQIEMARKMFRTAVKRNLTLVVTTHSEIIPLAIGKFVEAGELKSKDVKIYYFERSGKSPWTRLRMIKVYEDGTLDELPDSEKTTASLF